MKLRINAKLKAALIAAITAVGFTTFGTGTLAVATGAALFAGQQAWAEATETQLTLTLPASNQLTSGRQSINWQGSTSAGLSSWRLEFELDPGSTADQNIFNLNASLAGGTSAVGYHLGLTSVDTLNLYNDGGNVLATVKLSGQTPVTLSFVKDVDEQGGSLGTGTFTLTSTQTTDPAVAVVSQIGTSGTNNTTFHAGTAGDTSDTRLWTNGGKEKMYNIKLYQLSDAVLMPATWQGTVDNHSWVSTNFSPEFASGDSVSFGADGYKTVSVSEAVTAGKVSVSGVYTFELNNNLTAGTLDIAADGGLTLSGTSTMAVTDAIAIADGGSLSVGAGSALKLGFANGGNLLKTITGAGDIHIAADTLFAGSSAQGTPTTTRATGALIVDEGKTLKIGTTDTGGYTHTYVNMTSFNKVLLDGSTLWIHNDEFDLKNVTVTEKGGTVTIHDTAGQNNNTLNLKGTTQLNGTLTFNGTWKQKFTIDELAGTGTLKLAGTGYDRQIVNIGGGSAGELQIGKSNVEANITGNLTLGGLTGTEGTVNAAQGLTFNVAEGGEYSYTGTLTVGGQVVKQGAGSQTIGGYAMHRAIDVQAGTLALKGTYTIDAITDGETVDEYYDYEGQKGDNGFYLQSGSITVYKKAAESTVDTANAHFMYGGKDVTEAVVVDGTYTIPGGDPNYTTYHLNADGASVDLADAYTYSKEALTTVNVNGGNTTISVDSALVLDTLNIASGKSATISGAGSLTLGALSNSGSLAVGSTVTMGALALKSGETPAIQVQSGGVLTITTASTVDGQKFVNGESGEQGNTQAFSKLFKGLAVGVQDGGKLVLQGNMNFNDSSVTGAVTMTSGVAAMEITGNVQVNTYGDGCTWALGNHSLEVGGDLWLTNKQFLKVEGGNFAAGSLKLGHDANAAGGGYRSSLTATGNSTVALGGIAMYGGHNEVNIDGSTLTFTKADGNVLSQVKTTPTAAADFNKILLNNANLVAKANSWTLAPIAGTNVTMVGINGFDVDAEKTITLTVSSLNGSIVKMGEGSLVFTTEGEGHLTDSIKLQAGSLTLSGTYAIDAITDGSITTKTVDHQGNVSPNGFHLTSGSLYVYRKDDGTLDLTNAHFTYMAQDVTQSVIDNSGLFTLPEEPDKSTVYVTDGSLDIANYKAAAGDALTSVELSDGTTVNMDTAISVGVKLVNGASATVNATEDTTISSISGWSDNTLTVSGTGDVTLPGGDRTLAGSTALVVQGNVNTNKLIIGSQVGDTAALTVEEGATLDVNGNLTPVHGSVNIAGTVNITGDLDISNNKVSDVALQIAGTGAVTAAGMWMNKDASVSLAKDATYSVSDVRFTGKESGGSISVASGDQIQYGAGNAQTRISNLTMEALKDITIANQLVDVDVVTGAHTVSLNSAAGTVNVSTGGTINFGTSGAANAISVQDGGTIGTYAKTGEGDTAITSAGTAVLNSVIALQGGTLTMEGTYDISRLTGEFARTGYTGAEHENNGFAIETGSVQVVNITNEATLSTAEAAFSRGGATVEMNDSTGVAAVSGTNYAKFYINEETETLTKAQEQAELTTIYVATDGTLQVNNNMSTSLLDATSTGIVSIDADKVVTVDSTAPAVKLSGSGTYALADNTVSLGSVTLGEDWTGTVRLSNINKSDGNTHLDALVQGESWVEISGIKSGFLPGWDNGHVDVNIKLTNPDIETPAWVWNDGAGNAMYTLTFNGDWAGQGTFRKEASKNQSFTWTGNIAAWTGKFEFATNDKTTDLTFAGSATQVNAEIAKPGTGTLNLIVGNGTNAFSTEFTKSVTVSSITVEDNASATFNELHITQAIISTGTVTLNQNLEVSDFTENVGAAGYYDLDSKFTMDGNGYSGKADSFLEIVSGGTVVGDITVTQGDTTYNLLNSGHATLAGSGEATIDYTTFYVNTGIVDVSSITDGRTTGIQVSNGTLNVDTDASGFTIDVLEEGTISGDHVDATQVGIDNMATAHFSQPVETAGVEYAAAEGDVVSVRNIGEKAEFSTSNKDMIVYADTLTMTDTENDAVVGNLLWVNEVVNETGHKLTLENADNLLLDAMTIGAGSTVAVYTEGAESPEGTVTITESLTAGGATLLANLTIIGNGSEVAPTLLNLGGAGENALTLGSTLTVDTESGLILLDADTIAALEGLALGHNLDLFKALEETQLNYGAEYNGTWFDAMFVRTADVRGDYLVYASDTSFGLTKVSKTPEPTTGTLSLLALMALAARRRRH